MKTKPLTFLLALTFLFLFCGSVFGQETEVKKEYWDKGKLRSEEHYKDGKKEGLWTGWFRNGKKMSEGHYKDGKKVDFGLNGMKMGRKHSNELSKMETNS